MAKMKFSDTLQTTNKNNLMKFGEFKDRNGGDWEEYKLYLFQNNALAPELMGQFQRPQVSYNPDKFLGGNHD